MSQLRQQFVFERESSVHTPDPNQQIHTCDGKQVSYSHRHLRALCQCSNGDTVPRADSRPSSTFDWHRTHDVCTPIIPPSSVTTNHVRKCMSHNHLHTPHHTVHHISYTGGVAVVIALGVAVLFPSLPTAGGAVLVLSIVSAYEGGTALL